MASKQISEDGGRSLVFRQQLVRPRAYRFAPYPQPPHQAGPTAQMPTLSQLRCARGEYPQQGRQSPPEDRESPPRSSPPQVTSTSPTSPLAVVQTMATSLAAPVSSAGDAMRFDDDDEDDVVHEQSAESQNGDSPTDFHYHVHATGMTSIPRTMDYGSGYRPAHSKQHFERVQGRFSLLGSSNKYNVTVGEIKRRLSPPECLNTSLLGGLLRRGKGKNVGDNIRHKLESCGIALPPGRRKATSVSMLTSLVEAEAQDLSNQFTKVCQAIFPAAELARNVAYAKEPYLQRPGAREEEQHNIKAALQLVGELRELLEHYIAQEEVDRDNEDAPMTGLRSFSLITHSFGVTTISGVLGTLQAYLTGLLKFTGGFPSVEESRKWHGQEHCHSSHLCTCQHRQ